MAPRPQLAHVTVHGEFSCNLAMADWKTARQKWRLVNNTNKGI